MACRNVVLVTVDCLRFDHLPFHGYHRDTAPYLSEFADEATTFQSAFATGPGTSVSFPSIFASTYPFDYGGYEGLGDERTPVADVLSDAGVRTAGVHSNAYLTEHYGYDRGFDRYESFLDESLLRRLRLRCEAAVGTARARSTGSLLRNPGELLAPPAPYAPADVVTDLAVEWIDDFGDEPFFEWVHYMDVHGPYHPPHEHRLFGDEPIDTRRLNELWRRGLDDPADLTDAEVQRIVDAYDAEIRYVDDQLRGLMEALEERGLLSETTVIVTADHGEEFREHGQIAHRPRLYDELLHVPLLVRTPEDSLPAEVDELVSLLDVAPTVLEALGVEPPPSYRGRPLQRFGDGGDGYDAVFAGVSHQQGSGDQRYRPEEALVACRTGAEKYLRDNRSDEELFFDLDRDPDETDPDPETVTAAERDALRERIDEHLSELYAGESGDAEGVPEDVRSRLDDLGYV